MVWGRHPGCGWACEGPVMDAPGHHAKKHLKGVPDRLFRIDQARQLS